MLSRRYLLPGLPAVLAILGAVTPLRAQDAVADSARALFRAGKAAYEEPGGTGRARAVVAWEESARLYGAAGRMVDRANALGWTCRALTEAGPPAPALEACHRALQAYEATDSLADQAWARLRLAELHTATQQPDSALAQLHAAAALYQRAGRAAPAGTTWARVGRAEFAARRIDAAIAAYTSALDLHRSAQDSSGAGSDHQWLGFLERERDSVRAAVGHYADALALYSRIGPDTTQRKIHRSLGELYDRLGASDSALFHLTRSFGDPPIGMPAAEARTLGRLGDVYWKLGRPDSAAACQRAAIAIYRSAILNYPADAASRPLNEMHSAVGALFEKRGQLDSMTAHYRVAIAAGIVTPVDSALLLLPLGSRYASAGQLDSAITIFLEAARRFEAKGSLGLRNTALSRVATLFRDRGQLDSALHYGWRLLEAWRPLDNPREEASALMLVAGFHLQRAEFDSALKYSAIGLVILPPDAEARLGATLHGVRGTAFSSSGRYDSALVHHRAAVAGWQAAGELYQAQAARSMGHLGSVFRQLGQFDSALAYHRLARGKVAAGTSGELVALSDIAFDFEAAGALDSALSYQRERRDAARWRRENTTSDPAGDLRAEADAAERIGLLLLQRGESDSARAAFTEALASHRQAGTGGLDAAGLNDLATLLGRVGEEDSALAYHRRARDRAAATGAGAEESLALMAIGRLETSRGDPEAGLTALRQAYQRERSSGSLEVSSAILANIGYTLRRLPRPDLAGALAAFDTAAALRAAVRAQAGGDENRLSIAEQFTLPPGEWELTWLARGAEIGDQRAALASLAASERGRAQALLDLMRGTAPDVKPGADLVAEGRRLAAVATGGGAGLLSYLAGEDTLLIWYATAGPGRNGPAVVTTLKVAVSADSLAALAGRWRAALGVDQADLGGRLAARSAGPMIEETFRTGAAGRAGPAGDHTAIGAELARLLLPEELRLGKGSVHGQLVIVPHGALTVIPFGALPLGDSLSALGLRHALRYAPSLASLAEAEGGAAFPQGVARARRLKRALVVGDPLMPSPRTGDGEPLTLRQLPAAGVEGAVVARRVGVRSLSGAAATETAVRRLMPQAPLIHLATHGYAYASAGQARNSFVALAPDSAGDGLLTVGEVLGDASLRLSADLVVLSACQTGLGNLKRAEGTVGLQRAFLARGARSLLVSLWSVSDEATGILMDRFYHHWLGDRDQPRKAEALRRAQEDLRATQGFEAPRYWAPFQLVGAE